MLFEKGKSVSAYPLKLVFLENTSELSSTTQAMFVVPKRNYKRAHDRNKLKRRMREAYRLHKNSLYEKLELKNKHLLLALIYTSRKPELYKTIEASVLKLIGNFMKE